jgi:hypothetical protein
MPAHKQQKEDQYRETEIVVVVGADDICERFALQLRRSERIHPYVAQKSAAAMNQLEAVTVYQPYCGVLTDENAAMVHVADDAPHFMNCRKDPSGIGGRSHEKAPVCPLEVRTATLGAVQLMNIMPIGKLWEKQPSWLSRPVG